MAHAGVGSSRRRLRTAALAVAIVAAVVLAFTSGLVGHVSDQDRLRSSVDGAGLWGPLLFVGLMTLVVPLNVPGLVFVVPSTSLFGTAGGIGLSLLGGFLASAVGIVIARRFGRDTFAAKMPARVLAWEERLCHRGFWAVAGLRCVTFLMQPVDWLCGVSRMPMRTALAGTFVGLVPPTVAIALSGGGVLDLLA